MSRALRYANGVAVVIIVLIAGDQYAAPKIAQAVYADEYKALVFQCDQVMRDHFIAKQMVLASTTDETIRNLEAAELGLTTCHRYDVVRKEMLRWGLSENDLARIGLQAIERHAVDVRTFVEIHEIRY